MNKIFDVVYRSLKWLAEITKLTYEEINIIIWFIAIPAIYMYMIDRIISTNYFKIGYGILVILTLVIISDFEDFSKTIFKKSANFLHWFEFLGINYIQASVLICVLLPILIVGLLVIIIRKRNRVARISNKKQNPYIR